MDRLAYIILLTGDMAGMRRFYEEQVGLAARELSPDWIEFDTAGGTLALHATRDTDHRGVQLCVATDDVAARVRDLGGRGIAFDPPGIGQSERGRIAHFHDGEGNAVSLWEPAEPYVRAGAGPALSAAINCRDIAAQAGWYRDRLGFATTLDSPGWVQLAAGGAGLGLHPRGTGAEGHHARPITIGLAIPGLREWHDERVALGMAFTSPPTDRGYGTFADARDPDGNPVSFREVSEADVLPETLEERLAEPYEDEAAPARTAMRKPVLKRSKATSRVATRPQYRSARATATRRRRVSKPAARVASPRGTGPAGTRVKPKRRHDPKRARTKPATGRLRKAERRTFKSQKQAIAGASKRKPVKRASRARPVRRGVARRGSGRR